MRQVTRTSAEAARKIFHYPKKWWEDLRDTAVSNRTVAIATVIIALSTVATTWEIVGGAKQTDKIITAAQNIQGALELANINNAKALAQTLDRSKQSLDLAIDQIHLEQRAWVDFGLVGGQILLNQPIHSPVLLGNTGKTPAINVNADIVAELLGPNQEPTFVYSTHTGHLHEHLSNMTILPNQQLNFLVDINRKEGKPVHGVIFTPDVQRQINSGALMIVVHGSLTYDDAFGEHHWMRFCSFGGNQVPGTGPAKCNEWNQVDNKH